MRLYTSTRPGADSGYYLLADSPEGVKKEAEVSSSPPSTRPTHGDIRHGFVYERVPHITLKSIANDAEIDVIWDRRQPAVEAARESLNTKLKGHAKPFRVTTGGRADQKIDFTAEGIVTLPSGEAAPADGFTDWEIPPKAPEDGPEPARAALADFWGGPHGASARSTPPSPPKPRPRHSSTSPTKQKARARRRILHRPGALAAPLRGVDDDGELIDSVEEAEGSRRRESQEAENYFAAILENLKKRSRGRSPAVTFR